MSFLVAAFVLGIVSGLRAMMGLTAVSWAANRQMLPLEGTWLAFLGFRFTPYILSVLAAGEIINDKLPQTPSRLVPPQFIGRVVMGALCGAALGLSHGSLLPGLLAGVVGAVAGTLGGAKVRGLLAAAFGRDLPTALLEDVVAIALAVTAVVTLR